MFLQLFLVGGFWFYILLLGAILSLYVSVRKESSIAATFTLLALATVLWMFGDFNAFVWVYKHPIYFAIACVTYFVFGVGWLFFKWDIYVRDRNNTVLEKLTEYLRGNPLPTVTVESICVEDMQNRDYLKGNPVVRTRGMPVPMLDAENQPKFSEDQLKVFQLKWDQACREEVEEKYNRYNDRIMDMMYNAGLTEVDHSTLNKTVVPRVRNHKVQCVTWMSYWPISMVIFFLNDFVTRICQSLLDIMHDTLQNRAHRIMRDTKVTVEVPAAMGTPQK